MHVERWRRESGREGLEVLRDLADLVGRARLSGAHVAEGVAPRAVAGGASGEVVVLVGGEYEQRVRLGDAVCRQPGEKCAEGPVVVVELCHVVRLTGT